MTATRTHELPASWVISDAATGRVLCETFDPRVATRAMAVDRYRVETIEAYLGRVNRGRS